MNNQEIIISKDLNLDLDTLLNKEPFDKLFILTDEHTRKFCLSPITNICQPDTVICLRPGEDYKSLDSLTEIWHQLSIKGATRSSLFVNLGGGMITDLGGFAAATFKRGLPFINIPTTLLSMTDAAVGGKTGINFNGLKNEVGAFAPAKYVLIHPQFLKTLDSSSFFSGYAEMLKHGLINSSAHWIELLNFNTNTIDYGQLGLLIEKSVQIKKAIVENDPYEQNVRKALNFGHTIGHAFESLALEENRTIPHGYAVAWGMIGELYLSHLKTGFPKEKLRQIVSFIKESYGTFFFTCPQYHRLYRLMLHDKKNTQSDRVNFTLLQDIGKIKINQTITQAEIFDALDFYRECM